MTWIQRIKTAEKNGNVFTSDDHYDARADWSTCAVGEAFSKNPKKVSVVMLNPDDPQAGPKMGKLERLGVQFGDAVDSNNVYQTKQLYVAIQGEIARQVAKAALKNRKLKKV